MSSSLWIVNLCKCGRQIKQRRNSGSLLHLRAVLYHSKHTICFNTHLQTRFALPPYCRTTYKTTQTHVTRAGGCTLSGVRNNSFWPSPVSVLEWSPWVAAYQRATAIEWVVGITQPGFRTYTGHSKGRAHWAREIALRQTVPDHVWVRLDENSTPGFYDGALGEIWSCRASGGGVYSPVNMNLCRVFRKQL